MSNPVTSSTSRGVVANFYLLVFLAIWASPFVAIFCWDCDWFVRVRVTMQYGDKPLANWPANWPTVAIDQQPHDCEFMTAPMGNKHCRYERVVTTWSRQEISVHYARIDE